MDVVDSRKFEFGYVLNIYGLHAIMFWNVSRS